MTGWTIGIDPGKTGAIVMVDPDGALVAVHDMPYDGGEVIAPQLAGIVGNLSTTYGDTDCPLIAWVEKVGPMPRQGIASTWKFAQGYGTILGVLGALRVSTRLETPTVWKRAMRVTKDKGSSRALACRSWPGHVEMFSRVKDDGRAEAALIAEYGRRQELRS